MMRKDEPLDALLREALRQLDAPPPAPREQMWARIEAQRAARRNSESGTPTVAANGGATRPDVLELRSPRRSTMRWGTALAAMLVVGIGLGRMTMRSGDETDPPTVGSAAVADTDAGSAAYRIAASQHLQRTEALFASLSIDARTGGADDVMSWARELLTDTRLLRASPAAADPAMSRLLDDLELVLSQIASIPTTRAQEEVELIQDGINQSDVLMRMRAATMGRPLVGT